MSFRGVILCFFQMISDFTGSNTALFNYENHTISTLSLPSVRLTDSGNYSCQPASLQRVAIALHVLQEQKEQELVVKESTSDASHCYVGILHPTVAFIRIMLSIFL